MKNIFKFLEDKKGKRAPLKYKLLNDPKSITKDDLKVGGFLNLSYTKISSIPDNLTVRGSLGLINTKISSLPDNLNVGRDLYLYDTPLYRKYSESEIRQMLKDKGGIVKGDIYL